MERRTYLAAATSVAAVLAGCVGTDSADETTDNESSTKESEATDDTTTVTPADGVVEPGPEDDFSDLEAWTLEGGTLKADTDYTKRGEQSARLESGGTERLRFHKTFDEPVDVSNVVPGVSLRTDAFAFPWLRLTDTDGNRIDYRREITGSMPLMRYNFGITDVDAAYDPTAVESVSLLVSPPNDHEADPDVRKTASTVWVDELHFVPKPQTAKVMVQFDDAHETDYTAALPILEAYGYPAVTFINASYVDGGKIGGNSRLSTEQVHELHDAGWCISNHTKSHPDLATLTASEQEAEIRDGKRWLEQEGFTDGAKYFSYPFGSYDETTLELVERHHEIGFAGGPPAQGYLANTTLCSRIGEPTPARAKEALELAVEHTGITQLFFHRLEGARVDEFESIVETIHEYESAGELEVILPPDLEAMVY